MLAVSNTSPLSNLASVGRLDLLRSQFRELWIPSAVREELAAHPAEYVRVAIEDAIQSNWLRVAEIENSSLLFLMLSQLHRGEAEAIELALVRKAEIVVIDELEGRQVAARAGLRVTGVLGILLRAKQNGSLAEVRPVIEQLRAQAGFFISKPLEAKVIASAGE